MENEKHLDDSELFALAAPAAGDPEPLPEHLSRCHACARALQDWKESVRELARDDVAEIERRTTEEWRATAEATMASVRAAGRSRSPARPLRWVLAIAASLLVVYLAFPKRTDSTSVAAAPEAPAPVTSEFATAADRDDDALLREAARLARGGDDESDLAMEESL